MRQVTHLVMMLLLSVPAWATFPTVEDADTTTACQTTNSTSWTLTYPANIASGNLLLLFVGHDGTGTGSLPAGWTFVANYAADSSAAQLKIARKFATGSESGTFAFGPGASEQGCWRIVRITGAHASQEPAVSSNATGDSTAPDSLSLNPAGWDVEDTLWYSAEAADNGNSDATGFPTNYNNQFSDSSVGGNGAHLGTARRFFRSASDDPSAFTIDLSEQWAAATLAIRPAVPDPPARNRAVVIQ